MAPEVNTIFWDAGSFGLIKRDVYAIFSGGVYMWRDPVPSSALTPRSALRQTWKIFGASKKDGVKLNCRLRRPFC